MSLTTIFDKDIVGFVKLCGEFVHPREFAWQFLEIFKKAFPKNYTTEDLLTELGHFDYDKWDHDLLTNARKLIEAMPLTTIFDVCIGDWSLLSGSPLVINFASKVVDCFKDNLPKGYKPEDMLYELGCHHHYGEWDMELGAKTRQFIELSSENRSNVIKHVKHWHDEIMKRNFQAYGFKYRYTLNEFMKFQHFDRLVCWTPKHETGMRLDLDKLYINYWANEFIEYDVTLCQMCKNYGLSIGMIWTDEKDEELRLVIEELKLANERND